MNHSDWYLFQKRYQFYKWIEILISLGI